MKKPFQMERFIYSIAFIFIVIITATVFLDFDWLIFFHRFSICPWILFLIQFMTPPLRSISYYMNEETSCFQSDVHNFADYDLNNCSYCCYGKD